jgi:hypothetical protein
VARSNRREKCKRDQEQQERAARARRALVKQRIDTRWSQLARPSRAFFDLNKCPLLSRPGEAYLRSKLNNNSSSNASEAESRTRAAASNTNTNECNVSNANSLATAAKSNRSCLRPIYPSSSRQRAYERLFLLEQIADLFIRFTLLSSIGDAGKASCGNKCMSHVDFKHFTRFVLFHSSTLAFRIT